MIMEENKNNINTISNKNAGFGHQSLGELLLPYLVAIWVFRRKFLILNGSFFVIIVLYQLLFVKPYFESTITILPDYGSKSSSFNGLGGLASIVGVSIGDAASPSDIYQNLLYSESILEPVILSKYKTLKMADSVNLIQYFEISGDSSLTKTKLDRTILINLINTFSKEILFTTVDKNTKILDVTIRMPESNLSSLVVNNLVNSLDQYVKTKRKSNATTQRIYIEIRLKEVGDSLTQSEKNLEVFQNNNRFITQSPELVLRQSQIMRQIQILQNVYVQLASQLEITKIDEIRDAPIINIKEYSRDPVEKKGPSRVKNVIIIFTVFIFLSVIYFLSIELFKTYYKRFREKFNN